MNKTAGKKNTTKKGTKPVNEEIIKNSTTEEPIVEKVEETVAAEAQTVESSEIVGEIVEDIAPVFPPEEPVVTIPETHTVDTNVTVAKIVEPELVTPPVVKKDVVAPMPLQNDISIMVEIKNENILIFKGFMKVSEIVKSLKNSDKSTVTVQNKIVAAQLVELAKLSNPERVINKR